MNKDSLIKHNHLNEGTKNDCSRYFLGGLIYTIGITGKETDQNYSVLELLFPAGVEQNVPPHKHSNENIVFYVVKGNFLFEYGDKSIKADTGMLFNLKSNIFHSYKKIGVEEGKLIMIFSPAGFENYFKEVGMPIKNDYNTNIPNIKTDDDRITLHIGETKYGLKFVGE